MVGSRKILLNSARRMKSARLSPLTVKNHFIHCEWQFLRCKHERDGASRLHFMLGFMLVNVIN